MWIIPLPSLDVNCAIAPLILDCTLPSLDVHCALPSLSVDCTITWSCGLYHFLSYQGFIIASYDRLSKAAPCLPLIFFAFTQYFSCNKCNVLVSMHFSECSKCLA
ncbi:Hypothetical predicted protein [Octopus vulgaris]|uniref:Uncharacterized protein n=1 Tax=Octopus vulgaris TaxID=6645 RepID=A0AA36BUG0_OCTVU|nr:Hypothetical predicted protein [Octopus vulgaris]